MKNFLNTKTASKTNSLIIIFLSLFTLNFISFSFEAKADLVDEIVKKNNLDPKSNPKDQCELMNQLSKKISFKDGAVCYNGHSFCCDKTNNICEAFVATYGFKYIPEKKFFVFNPSYHSNLNPDDGYLTYSLSLIYNKKQKKILGISVKRENGDEYVYDIKEILKDKDFADKSELWIDIRNHPEFKKAKLQDKTIFFTPDQEMNFDDGDLRFVSSDYFGKKINNLKDLSFIKTRGCYVDEFNIPNNPNLITTK